MKNRGLNELLCAALINETFRLDLLQEPRRAALAGYDGHAFDLTEFELDVVGCIRADSFEEFCVQVAEWLNPKALKYQFIEPVSCPIAVDLPLPLQNAALAANPL